MAEPPATAATEPADPGTSRQAASMMAALAASHATTARRHAEQAASDALSARLAADAAGRVWRRLRWLMPILAGLGAMVGAEVARFFDRLT